MAKAPSYIQAERPLRITTPLGKDALLITRLRGTEQVSRLFRYELELLAERQREIDFKKLLGKRVTVELEHPVNSTRYFDGICSRISQGATDSTFTAYEMEVVPEFWFLTRRIQSRIFQHLSVPQILKRVLAGLQTEEQLQGSFEPRDYTVQYRESDFAFASRIMEEEGIYYYFKHSANGHVLVLANHPGAHAELENPAVPIVIDPTHGGIRDDSPVRHWAMTQTLRSGRVTLWDHTFEIPHKHLEAQAKSAVPLPGTDRLEVYDWPGGYAKRFDGVDKGGGERPQELTKIQPDGQRAAKLRMEEIDARQKTFEGKGQCGQFVVGHQFKLTGHPIAPFNDRYVLTNVEHHVQLNENYRSDGDQAFTYENRFECIPLTVPYRPELLTPRPLIHGAQTAVVVGPKAEEIFTDKYGRVKVQFHWDRDGTNNADSSCWVRVAQVWAGRRWGASFWPRVGQEVVVAFEEGDPDRPIIIGSVYNADQMPPYLGKGPDGAHPNDNKVSGIKSNTTPGGQGFNELRFDDTQGREQVFIHAQKDLDERVLNDTRERVLGDRHMVLGDAAEGGAAVAGNQREAIAGEKHLLINRHHVEHIRGHMKMLVGGHPSGLEGGDQHLVVKQDQIERIERDQHLTVRGSRAEAIGGADSLSVGGDRMEAVGGADHRQVKGDRKEKVGGSQSLTVSGSQDEKIGAKHAVEAGTEIHLKAGMKVVIEAGVQVTLKGPGGFVDIGPAGVTIQGIMVLINSGGAAGAGSGASPAAPSNPASPKDAIEAAPVAPDQADDAVTGQKSN